MGYERSRVPASDHATSRNIEFCLFWLRNSDSFTEFVTSSTTMGDPVAISKQDTSLRKIFTKSDPYWRG